MLRYCIILFYLHQLLISQHTLYVRAFNVDSINYVRHEGQADSMFGFSVALHQENQKSWVIIGAPTADTSSIQNNVRRGGAVYRCNASDDNRCQVIPFDSHGNQYNEKGEQVDTKAHQWFGATVASGGINGPLVACAPRYVFHSLQPKKVERVEPVGTCYLAKDNFQVYTEYSPCRTMFWGYHRQGSCQAGMSAAITKNGDRLFIGAPGSWYWQGQAYSINTEAVYPYKPPRYGQFGEGGQTYSFNLNGNPRDKVWSTGESTAAEDDSYLGYSTITGDFNGDGTEGVAIGMPRGSGLLGKVLIFSWNMTNQQNITGEQIGSYFGYSMCVVDVDGDKLDDLIIGAPMYTEPNNEGKYEMGRVYIIYQDKYNKFQTLSTRDGFNSRARFGLALTSLGDINLDGYGDFAVGAPYDGPNGYGAIYIYHGSSNGPLEKYSQVIYSEDVAGTTNLKTFGFSLSGGIDLDGNMYPDLVVGAYESNKAIVFRSRPVAVMEASTLFESDSKLISLDEKNCTVGRDQKRVTCMNINSCLKYNGINLQPTIDIEVSWLLDTKKNRSPRLFFVYERDEGKNLRNSTMRLYRGKIECRSDKVYITENIRDKLTPLEVEMRFNIRSYSAGQPVVSRTRRAALEPVLDQNKGTVKKDSINIQKNCGPDNICIPDLRLNVKSVEKYLLGSKELLTVDVFIPNFGEDAFEAGFYMTIPAGLNFRKIERIGDSRKTPITCTAPSVDTNNTLKCDIGNPLSSGQTADFKVIMMPSQKYGMAPSYDFYMEANSTNVEVEGTSYDNIVRKSIGIWVETDLSIKGKASDEEIHYNVSEYMHIENATHEQQIGPQVVSFYEIRNGGPSTIEEAEIFLLIPYATNSGDALMYLLNQPETSGNIRCEPTIYANQRNLILNQTLASKSYLESLGAIERSSFHGSYIDHGSSVHSVNGGGSFSGGSSGISHHRVVTHDSSGGNTIYTEEERRKLDAEENEESIGDASLINLQRSGQANQLHNNHRGNYKTSGGSSGAQTWTGPTVTYTASRNRTLLHGSDGHVKVYESSTELYENGAATVDKHANIHQSHSAHNQRQHHQMHGDVNLGIESQSRNIQQTVQGTPPSGSSRRRMMSQQDGEPSRSDLITGVSPMEKVAQGGRGFQTSSLDLGVYRNNIEDSLKNRQRENTYQHQQTVGGYHQNYSTQQNQYQENKFVSSGERNYHISAAGRDSGRINKGYSTTYGRNGISSNGATAASTTTGGADDEYEENYSDDVDEEYYEGNPDEKLQNSQYTQQQSAQLAYQQSASRQTIPLDQRFKHYQRLRREILLNFNDLELDESLRCNTTKCAILRCTSGPLEMDSVAWISIRTRLVATTMNMVAPSVPLNLSTMVVARVSKLPYIGSPQEKPLKRHEVVITARPIPDQSSDVVPLWVVVLSACAGVIILLLLIYVLYKCGFFNRNRPSDSQERQPLNRNGAYHGDEHL